MTININTFKASGHNRKTCPLGRDPASIGNVEQRLQYYMSTPTYNVAEFLTREQNYLNPPAGVAPPAAASVAPQDGIDLGPEYDEDIYDPMSDSDEDLW